MKKIILFAVVCIAAVSCSKEKTCPVQPASSATSMEQQTADLIKKADKELYHNMYETKRPRPIVKAIPGIFYIPSGGIDEATCWPAFNVCMVIVIERKSPIENVTGPEGGLFVNGEYNEVFPQDVIAELIINRPVPEKQIITEIHATKDADETYHIHYH
jgi:hypothetical protein